RHGRERRFGRETRANRTCRHSRNVVSRPSAHWDLRVFFFAADLRFPAGFGASSEPPDAVSLAASGSSFPVVVTAGAFGSLDGSLARSNGSPSILSKASRWSLVSSRPICCTASLRRPFDALAYWPTAWR